MSKVTVGLLQHACGPDPAANFKKMLGLAERAARKGAQIICTQELLRSQNFCHREDHASFKLAEAIPGPSTAALQKLAKRLRVVMVASLFEKRASGLYHNTSAVIDADGSLLGAYRKMHIPDDPLYYEKFYFTPGDTGFRSWTTAYGRIGVLICWDQWFPEAARLTALQGAEIILYPTAIGWHPREKAGQGAGQHDAWETIQRGHAIANGCFVRGLQKPWSATERPGGGRGNRILGPKFRGWHRRPDSGPGRGREGGGPDRFGRPRREVDPNQNRIGLSFRDRRIGCLRGDEFLGARRRCRRNHPVTGYRASKVGRARRSDAARPAGPRPIRLAVTSASVFPLARFAFIQPTVCQPNRLSLSSLLQTLPVPGLGCPLHITTRRLQPLSFNRPPAFPRMPRSDTSPLDSGCFGLPHAGRVGAPRGGLDFLAAPARLLAVAFARPIPPAVRPDRSRNQPARKSANQRLPVASTRGPVPARPGRSQAGPARVLSPSDRRRPGAAITARFSSGTTVRAKWR